MARAEPRDYQLKIRVTKRERDTLHALAYRQRMTLTDAFRLGMAKALLMRPDPADEAS